MVNPNKTWHDSYFKGTQVKRKKGKPIFYTIAFALCQIEQNLKIRLSQPNTYPRSILRSIFEKSKGFELRASFNQHGLYTFTCPPVNISRFNLYKKHYILEIKLFKCRSGLMFLVKLYMSFKNFLYINIWSSQIIKENNVERIS